MSFSSNYMTIGLKVKITLNSFTFKWKLCDQTLKDIIEMNKSIVPKINYMIRTEILRQLLLALNYLHSMTPKVIHRDIKPSNVLIKYHDDHAQVKLCDFGSSKILEKETSNTSGVGTFKYRAPEIFTNNYNEKVDIYSLGIMTREMFDILYTIISDEDGVCVKMKQLKFVINKMMHGSPEERPSVDDILNQKNDWLFGSDED